MAAATVVNVIRAPGSSPRGGGGQGHRPFRPYSLFLFYPEIPLFPEDFLSNSRAITYSRNIHHRKEIKMSGPLSLTAVISLKPGKKERVRFTYFYSLLTQTTQVALKGDYGQQARIY